MLFKHTCYYSQVIKNHQRNTIFVKFIICSEVRKNMNLNYNNCHPSIRMKLEEEEEEIIMCIDTAYTKKYSK